MEQLVVTVLGETVSHYRITGLLGRGGMGEVYEAEDLRLGRTVAVKVLSAGGRSDPGLRERFEREARAASRLDHPNVGVVHDIGETDGGALFIVMTRYAGGTLRDQMEAGPMDVDQAVDVAAQIARGLAAAHEAGLVHRDVKPENVAFTERGRATVIDFGVAKLSEATVMTQDGTMTGSAAYMSPEQARGEPVDGRSDLWSVGVVLYEMLAGRRPFDGAYAQAVLYQVVHEEPVPLREVRPDVPDWVEGIVSMCLAKRAGDRYPDASSLGYALAGPDTGEPSAAEWSSPVPAKRTRPMVWAMFASLGVIAIISLSLWWSGRGLSPTEAYEQGEAELREYLDPARVAAAAGFFVEAIDADSTFAPAWAALGEAEVYLGKLSGDTSYATRARVHSERAVSLAPRLPDGHVSKGLVELWIGDPDQALTAFRLAHHLDSTDADAWRGLGDAYFSLGDVGAAERAYRGAIRHDSTHWASFNKLGALKYTVGEYREAARLWEQAEARSPENVAALSNWGAALHDLGEPEEAESVFRRLIEVEPTAGALLNLGTALFYQGRFDEAASYYQRALRHDPDDYEARSYLATSFSQLPDQKEKARANFRYAADGLRSVEGWEADPDLVATMASYLAALGDANEAQRLAQRASSPRPTSPSALIDLSTAYARLGDLNRAAQWSCAALLAGYPERLVRSNPDLLGVWGGKTSEQVCDTDGSENIVP